MKATHDAAALTLSSLLPITVPLGDLGVLVAELVGLLQKCFPDPTPDAVASLREPPYGIAGVFRYLWRRKINNAVAKSWHGDPEYLAMIQEAVLVRIRQGVPQTAIARLYLERKGNS